VPGFPAWPTTGRDRHARVFQAVVHLHGAARPAGLGVDLDAHQGQFNDLLAAGIEAGGFGVEQHHVAHRPLRWGELQAGLKPTQHTEIGMCLQLACQTLNV